MRLKQKKIKFEPRIKLIGNTTYIPQDKMILSNKWLDFRYLPGPVNTLFILYSPLSHCP